MSDGGSLTCEPNLNRNRADLSISRVKIPLASGGFSKSPWIGRLAPDQPKGVYFTIAPFCRWGEGEVVSSGVARR
jgi:hypothetical protein